MNSTMTPFRIHVWGRIVDLISFFLQDAQKGTDPAPSLAIAAPEDVNKWAQSPDDPAIGVGGSWSLTHNLDNSRL